MPDDLGPDGRDIHAYEIEDRPGARLMIGVPPGRTRPALWIEHTGFPDQTIILAQFHGEKHACVTINFLDATVNQINRVIQFYRDKEGDTP